MADGKKFWEIKNAAQDVGEVYIYGDIVNYKWYDTDVTAKDFAEELEELGDVKALNIYINSSGGSVFQAQAIHSMLRRHKARKVVYIDGLAASAASVIAMAGDAILMPVNAMMMIHNPWTFTWGNAAELRKEADDLDKITESIIAAYMEHATITEQEIRDMMDAETWLTAEECHGTGCAPVLEEESRGLCEP